MRTPYWEDDSPDDGRTAPRAYHCSLVSLSTRRRSIAFSKHVFSSAMIWTDDPLSTFDHGAWSELLVMLSEIAAASHSIATPVSEKKLHCVKTGSLTKSWTHNRTPPTTSSFITTRSKFTVNLSPDVTSPRMTSAVDWKTWNKSEWASGWHPHRNLFWFWGLIKPALRQQHI